MESPRITRSKTIVAYDHLKVKQVQDKITQQYAAPKKPKQNSLRIAVLKKNYRRRLIEEINERKRQIRIQEFIYSAENLGMEIQEKLKKSEEKSPRISEKSSTKAEVEPNRIAGKLNGGKSLIKPTKFLNVDSKKTSFTLDDIKKRQISPLRHTKSFGGVTKPLVEVKKPKIVLLDVPKPVILTKLIPATPRKQKPQAESKTRSNFGFAGRSLFLNIGSKSQKSENFHPTSEAAMNQSEQLKEINEKMRYVRQLEKEFNENKIKRQKIEDEEKEKEKKSKKRLSFGKNPLHFLVLGGKKGSDV